MPRSPQLSLSGCSSLFSLSSTSTSRDDDSAAAAPPPPSLHPLPPRRPLLSLSVGGGEEEQEDEEEYLLGGLDLQLTGAGGSSNNSGCCDGDDERKNMRMMKNRESALRSRARKRVAESGHGCTDPVKQQQEQLPHQKNLLLHSALATFLLWSSQASTLQYNTSKERRNLANGLRTLIILVASTTASADPAVSGSMDEEQELQARRLLL
ncbi:hypothetical protein HU200_024411 [Digitaria exilis]|uniref:BZIP domain-containing protein n=1 Tax=Digitaria exilis TaxID=1010633 RepID=A0A835C746_9POAL|nr:hypothetical protein HU200_024411 [Digitaria exilis]